MKNKEIGWLVFIGILVYYYISKIQAANALMVRYLLPQNIRFQQGALIFDMPVVVTNPTGTSINLNRFNFTVAVEGYPVGTAYGAIGVQLLAASDTQIISKVVVPLDALISVVPGLLNAGATLDAKFTGHIFAEGFTVPVDRMIKIPIPKILR